MPHHPARSGDHVSLVLKGYVVYNMGGFIAITNDKQVVERYRETRAASETEELTFDHDANEFYFDIPGWMVSDVTPMPEWPNGTIARCRVAETTNEWLVLAYTIDEGSSQGRWTEPNDPSIPCRYAIGEVVPIWDPENDS